MNEQIDFRALSQQIGRSLDEQVGRTGMSGQQMQQSQQSITAQQLQNLLNSGLINPTLLQQNAASMTAANQAALEGINTANAYWDTIAGPKGQRNPNAERVMRNINAWSPEIMSNLGEKQGNIVINIIKEKFQEEYGQRDTTQEQTPERRGSYLSNVENTPRNPIELWNQAVRSPNPAYDTAGRVGTQVLRSIYESAPMTPIRALGWIINRSRNR